MAGDTNKSLGHTAARETLMGPLLCGPLSPLCPHFPFPQQGLALPCAGSPWGAQPHLQTPVSANNPCAGFSPLFIPVNMFQLIQFALALSRIEHSGCQSNIQKKAAPAPCSWSGREGSMWHHPWRGQTTPLAPKTQLGCTSDQQQVTQEQRTKSHLYSLLHRVSLHYLRKNTFSSSLYSFPFALPAVGE